MKMILMSSISTLSLLLYILSAITITLFIMVIYSLKNRVKGLDESLQLSKSVADQLEEELSGEIETNKSLAIDNATLSKECERFGSDILKLENAKSELDEVARELRAKLDNLSEDKNNAIAAKVAEISNLKQEKTSLQEQIKGYVDRAELIEQTNKERQEQFVTLFENVAQEILEKRSEKFLVSSRESVSKIVEPLSRELAEFGKKVDKQFVENTKDSASLRSELSKLMELNHKLDSEAKSLVKAIKGEYNPKIQGDWGEMILEKILTNSGLLQDQHYFLQESNRDDDGALLRPDVVVRYPDGREVIIDSKVSMTAYMRYTAATDDLEMKKAENDHITSIRRHIDSLSSKRYNYKEESLDFVMMFIAVEPAYILALTTDKELWEYAYKRKILLVTPTHLITALKLIYDLWSRDAQNKNAEEIAKRGALMLDKFIGFMSDMEAIKRNLDATTKSYDNAMGKLSAGTGNLVRQAEMLSDLGVRSSKQLKVKS